MLSFTARILKRHRDRDDLKTITLCGGEVKPRFGVHVVYGDNILSRYCGATKIQYGRIAGSNSLTQFYSIHRVPSISLAC